MCRSHDDKVAELKEKLAAAEAEQARLRMRIRELSEGALQNDKLSHSEKEVLQRSLELTREVRHLPKDEPLFDIDLDLAACMDLEVIIEDAVWESADLQIRLV